MRRKAGSLGVALVGHVLLAGMSHAQQTSLNLTSTGASGAANGALFKQVLQQSTGTGQIDPFVRLSQQGNNTTAQGFNADARPVMGDVNTSTQYTHDLRLSQVPLVVDPTAQSQNLYYEFLLDINQESGQPLLSLDKIDIYTRASPLANASSLSDLTGASGVALRYSLDAGPDGDTEILLNYGLNTGSGSGDMVAYVPQSLLGNSSDYVYFYSHFGGKGGAYVENAGFEEWAVRKGVEPPSESGPVPDPVPDVGSSLTLLSAGLLGMAGLRRLLRK